jgi:serpin B
MKTTLAVFLTCIVVSAPFVAKAQVQALVGGNTGFALNLYGELATNDGNLFFSPYSISTCLAMTYMGARGETDAQMAQVLGFETNQEQFASDFGLLQAELEANQNTNAVELNIANALWTQDGFPFLSSFLETATNQFQADINQADFGADAGPVTQEINSWVAQETHNKIQNILSPGSLNSSTRLVLANAIYFLGAWTDAFATSNTTTQPFYVSSVSQVDVPTMHQPILFLTNGGELEFNYMETNDFQAIELPYGTNQASMLILLPKQIDGLPQLEQQLSPALFSNVLAQMNPLPVNVYLPRFTLESTFNLCGPLAEMGMPDAFAPGVADFSGIDGAADLFIGLIAHKAWGQVNEAGTEAAGATVVVIVDSVAGSSPPVFRANHPFMFFIRDNQSGSLLFAGRVADPSQSPPSVPPALQLALAVSGNRLKISWPFPSTGWTLRQTADLSAANWTPSGGVSNDGTNNFIAITPAPGNLFFQLSQ